jgi:hypothetical protein
VYAKLGTFLPGSEEVLKGDMECRMTKMSKLGFSRSFYYVKNYHYSNIFD